MPQLSERLLGLPLPVVNILAETQAGHLDQPLGTDKTVPRGQVFVYESAVGEMLHSQGHLAAEGDLRKEWAQPAPDLSLSI